MVSQNLRRLDDSQKYSNEALRFIGSMTERERLTTRGFRARITGDYKLCQQEYRGTHQAVLADIVGHNQFALCQTQLRHLAPAVESMKRVVQIVPNLALFRVNLAWYSSYAGDFELGEREALTIKEQDIYSTHALAFADSGRAVLTTPRRPTSGSRRWALEVRQWGHRGLAMSRCIAGACGKRSGF